MNEICQFCGREMWEHTASVNCVVYLQHRVVELELEVESLKAKEAKS